MIPYAELWLICRRFATSSIDIRLINRTMSWMASMLSSVVTPVECQLFLHTYMTHLCSCFWNYQRFVHTVEVICLLYWNSSMKFGSAQIKKNEESLTAALALLPTKTVAVSFDVQRVNCAVMLLHSCSNYQCARKHYCPQKKQTITSRTLIDSYVFPCFLQYVLFSQGTGRYALMSVLTWTLNYLRNYYLFNFG